MIDGVVRDWLRDWPGLEDACSIESGEDDPTIPPFRGSASAKSAETIPATSIPPPVAHRWRGFRSMSGEIVPTPPSGSPTKSSWLCSISTRTHPIIQGVTIENSFRPSTPRAAPRLRE